MNDLELRVELPVSNNRPESFNKFCYLNAHPRFSITAVGKLRRRTGRVEEKMG
ncbi:hypothetical protein D1BOALGB6SA_141 [Olavius sp. associated proteobacterium Delta 1]|nr:hypothetical protein D1BOALGB6SA_141 [Olavius sp. associated proteobacterium Delta 1]